MEYPNFKGDATFNTLDTVNLTNGISNEKNLDFDGIPCANYVFEIIAGTGRDEKDVLTLDFQIGPDLLHKSDIMISSVTDSKGKQIWSHFFRPIKITKNNFVRKFPADQNKVPNHFPEQEIWIPQP